MFTHVTVHSSLSLLPVVSFNNTSTKYTDMPPYFSDPFICSVLFFADLSGTEGFLYKHSTSINVFVIKHRPGHVISQTLCDGAGGMDVAWQAAASHRLHPAV